MASRFSDSPSLDGGVKLAASIPGSSVRPASSDTFEPYVAKATSRLGKPMPDENAPGYKYKYTEGGQIERLSEAIKHAHIFPVNARFRLMRTGNTIALSTYRHPFGEEVDMKIDALLVAREILNTGPHGAKWLKVYLFDEQEQSAYTQATVDLDLVKHFDSGGVSNNAMLEALSLTHETLCLSIGQMSSQTYDQIASSVRPVGPLLQQERAELFHQIDRLQNSGANVNGLKTAYLLLEDAIRQNDDLGARAAYALATELLDNAKLKAGLSSAR